MRSQIITGLAALIIGTSSAVAEEPVYYHYGNDAIYVDQGIPTDCKKEVKISAGYDDHAYPIITCRDAENRAMACMGIEPRKRAKRTMNFFCYRLKE